MIFPVAAAEASRNGHSRRAIAETGSSGHSRSALRAYASYGLALIVGGRASEGLAAAEKESDPADRLASLVVAYWATGKRVESDAALNELVKYPTARPTDIAGALAYRGNRVAALDWLEQAFRQHDTRLQFLRVDPLYKGLRAELRFKSLLSKMKLDS